jgi:1,4-alpha-glucan branching enzyme
MVLRRGKGKVTFVFEPRDRFKKVTLVGSFNNWDPDGHRMTRQKDGTYRKQLSLAPGEYEYKFLADGQWFTDPTGEGVAVNQFGAENSTIALA